MDTLIIFCAKYLLIFVVLGLIGAWIWAPRDKKLQFFVTTVLSGIVAFGLARLLSSVWYDPRPFVNSHIQPLIQHAADNGMPSDHALFTMTLTVVTWFFSKKFAFGMLVLTVLVGIARVLAHVHSPVDIIASWVIAVISCTASYILIRHFFINTAKHTPSDS